MSEKTPACGDGVVDDGEQCDDGNTADGDCCGSTCQLEPPGAQTCNDGKYCTVDYACGGGGCMALPRDCDDGNPCTYDYCDELGDACGHAAVGAFSLCDDGLYCTDFDHCDGSGACVTQPRNCNDSSACTTDSCDEGAQTCVNGVRAPDASCKHAETSKILLKDDPGNPGRRLLMWKWLHGEETTSADVGTPNLLDADGLSLCIYDDTNQLVSSPNAVAGYTWKPLGSGYRYSDRNGYYTGMSKALIKYGDQGRAKVIVKAKGSNLTLPALPRGSAALRLQLRKNSGPACWESTFTPPFEVDGPTQLKDSE
jgi:cysteine-rich repeat protein